MGGPTAAVTYTGKIEEEEEEGEEEKESSCYIGATFVLSWCWR
jgi:hypothetical protein